MNNTISDNKNNPCSLFFEFNTVPVCCHFKVLLLQTMLPEAYVLSEHSVLILQNDVLNHYGVKLWNNFLEFFAFSATME
jgi:hypothetical protein